MSEKKASPANSSWSVISLFSGVGGLDLGAQALGIRIAGAFDIDPHALTLHSRIIDSPSVRLDLSEATGDQIRRNSDPYDKKKLIVSGGPPCTAFSHAGFWIDEKRNSLDSQALRLHDFSRIVLELQPQAFILENVPGLAFRNHSHNLRSFVAALNGGGYSTSYRILNAADFGVPQARRRLFMIGVKSEKAISLDSYLRRCDQIRPVKWAFRGLTKKNNPSEASELLRGKYADLLPLIPPGDNYLFLTEARGYKKPVFKARSKYWSFLCKLHPDRTSPTIPATRVSNNGPFHWENRRLRARELSRLQTFPDFAIRVIDRDVQRHVGNAVPPLLAAELFRVLSEMLDVEVIPSRQEALSLLQKANVSYPDINAFFDYGRPTCSGT
jgi:DNA (cytosine-5)-methyltransferase 1